MKSCFQMRMHLSSLYIRDARTVHWLNNGTRVAWSHTLAGMHRRGEEELIKIPRQTPPRSIEQPNARTKIRLKIDGRRLSQWSCPVSMKPLGRSVANVWGCGCKNFKKAGLLRRGWRGVVVEYHVCVCGVGGCCSAQIYGTPLVYSTPWGRLYSAQGTTCPTRTAEAQLVSSLGRTEYCSWAPGVLGQGLA